MHSVVVMIHPHSRAHTHSVCVIVTAFPRQQQFRERATLLRYTHIACLVLSLLVKKTCGRVFNAGTNLSVFPLPSYFQEKCPRVCRTKGVVAFRNPTLCGNRTQTFTPVTSTSVVRRMLAYCAVTHILKV